MLDAGEASTAFSKMRERATRSIGYSENEWIRAHSKYRLWSKRVGFAPLETAILPKMSG
jgi:hypothetical protein